MFWIFTFGLLMGLALDRHNAQQITSLKFSCEGRTSGYYADVTTGCQVYHMCDGLGRQFTYTCPNATLFQQRMLICDHWYMVNCSRSEDDYSANLLIGQKKPFVEDSVIHPYYRTPRPDLLSVPSSASEYNIIYRTGSQERSPKNIVGVESESDDSSSTDEPTYFPPSHWSTEYSAQSTTAKSIRSNIYRANNIQNNIYRTNYATVKKTNSNAGKIKAKAIELNSSNRNENNFAESSKVKTNEFKSNNPTSTDVPINFKSNFRATTPVFPLTVDDTTKTPDEVGLLPPNSYTNSKIITNSSTEKQVRVNFNSNFKATTPVYPTREELQKELRMKEEILNDTHDEQIHVNFKSNFTATTPVYPSSVASTSPDPGEVGLLPPQSNGSIQQGKDLSESKLDGPKLSLSFEPPKYDENYKNNKDHDTEVTEAPPSMFYQPPEQEPDYTINESQPEEERRGIKIANFMKSFDKKQWQDLRKVFRIPEYEFPLEDATRPSYDSVVNSFGSKLVNKR